MLTRRQFLVLAAGTGALAIVPGSGRDRRAAAVALPGGDTGLDPTAIPKYRTALAQPAVMPRSAVTTDGVHVYDVAARPTTQQMLPPGLPTTAIWAYGPAGNGAPFTTPAATIVATADVPVRVRWRNQLVDAGGRYVPHLLPVDPSLHWANPAGPVDGRPTFTSTPGPYTGPVPLVTHVHGAHTSPDSDGYPESWTLPAATNIPAGYARTGSRFDQFDRTNAVAGSTVFQYDNDQRATTLWYHDHTLGLTRLNVYAGLAGLYLINGGPADIGSGGALPNGPYEMAWAIQDRSFDADGSLFYPDTRAFFDGGVVLDYLPTNGSPLPPIWNPEFFANTMTVNGRTWPRATLEARRHRVRILNGCNSRFLLLKVTGADPLTLASDEVSPSAVPMHLIGGDGGFAPRVAALDELLISPGERADVVLDLTGVAPGTVLYLVNDGPDEPFGGGTPGVDYAISDSASTRQVMQIVVTAASGPDPSTPVDQLVLPAIAPVPAPHTTRLLSLNEEAGLFVPPGAPGGTESIDTPIAAKLGLVDLSMDMGMGMMWMDPTTETPALGSTEEWQIYNFTMDAHPIHVHLVTFEVVDRQQLETNGDGMALPRPVPGTNRAPDAWEAGLKDMVVAYPGEVTRIKATYDYPGRFVWHCHIVEHEDNEMMRPIDVTVVPSIGLGEAAEYALLSLGGSNLALTNATVVGNVGAGPRSVRQFRGTSISRACFVDATSRLDRSNTTRVRGGVVVRPLATAVTHALTASAAAAALPVHVNLRSVTRAATVSAVGPRTVVSIRDVALRNADALTLQGSPSDEFVLNVTGDVKLSGTARLALRGVLPSNVLVNMVGRGRELNLATGAAVNGIVLNPKGNLRMNGGTITGAAIVGGEVNVAGGARIART